MMHILEQNALDELFRTLVDRGYTVVGPTVRDGAVVYDELRSVDDLPRGWTDEQDAGRYRLRRGDGPALFDHAVGPGSPKAFLHPPSLELWSARRSGASFEVEPEPADTVARYAFLGVRPCDLAAVAVLDRVFLGGPAPDPHYRRRRDAAFVVAVNCGHPAATCFCASMGTGPRAESGYDLALTEILEDGRHYFTVEVGSDAGADVLAAIAHEPARPADRAAADRVVDRARAAMVRSIDAEGAPELLAGAYDDPHWEDVAARCLACTNCTSVCPTCFCFTIEDASDLRGDHAERRRRWDSCFTLGFSYIHGGSVRDSLASRYRQWLTHKLGTWVEQFGTSGCVGCGRCIAWCPAGIDITRELAALQRNAAASAQSAEAHSRVPKGERP